MTTEEAEKCSHFSKQSATNLHISCGKIQAPITCEPSFNSQEVIIQHKGNGTFRILSPGLLLERALDSLILTTIQILLAVASPPSVFESAHLIHMH